MSSKNTSNQKEKIAKEVYKIYYNYVRDMSYDDFLAIRVTLRLDDVNVIDLTKRIKAMFKQYDCNHGISVEDYLTLSKHTDDPKENFELLIPFFYLDYNENGTLDVDELLFGFILMCKGTQKEKLEACFMICDYDNTMTLNLKQLAYYLRAVIRAQHGRKSHTFESGFEFENYLDKISEATAVSIFNEIDLNHDHSISLDEFLIWHHVN